MDVSAYNDQPIEIPGEDRFGIDPFARTLATSICKLKSPNGSVIALNGPWGSGKSSAVNLIRHHLAEPVKANELALIDFACWWFRGEDALALAFFRELYAGLAPSLGDKLKKLLPKLGARLVRLGSIAGGAADLAGAGGAGVLTGRALEWLGGLIEQEESVEKLHGELAKVLADQAKRFLIIIDDIDRLSPDEALLIFRLVKSVGCLPNVMYLLVYDRQLAEKIVSEHYPSEGPHYLEKIVQAAFELPEPSSADVRQHLLALIESICGTPGESEMVRFMNIFHEGVAPVMRTPRDVARFTNSLSVTWPAVAGEVNLADFLALEVLRLLHPHIYRAIRQNKEGLCGSIGNDGRNREALSKRYQELFFGPNQTETEEKLRRMLMRIFPALESVWGGLTYDSDFTRQWAMERRVCSEAHFTSYFRFAVGEDVLPRTELDEFISRAEDRDFVTEAMRNAAKVMRRAGGTKAAVLLDELTNHAGRIEREKVQPLLSALFSISDEIDVEADKAKAFSIGSNELRLHWLLRALTMDRFSSFERSAIFVAACETASLGWLADFVRSAWTNYHPREGRPPELPEKCLTTEVDAGRLRDLLRTRIDTSAKDGTLATHKDLAFLLHWWNELAADDGKTVRAWTTDLFATDDGVKQLSRALTSYGWAQGLGIAGLGDLVAKRVTHVNVESMAKLLDLEMFRTRVEAVASVVDAPELTDFLGAWRRADAGDRT